MPDGAHTTGEVAVVTHATTERLTARNNSLVTACLTLLSLLLGVSLAVVVVVALNLVTSNDDLREELACRSIAANNFATAQGRVEVTTARGLVALSRGEPLSQVEAQLEQQAADLERLSVLREESVVDCRVPS